MRVSYSEDADVLYLIFSDQRTGATYIEKDSGDILRVDASSGRLLGVTIQLFLHRLSVGEIIDIPEVDGIPFNAIMKSLVASRTLQTH